MHLKSVIPESNGYQAKSTCFDHEEVVTGKKDVHAVHDARQIEVSAPPIQSSEETKETCEIVCRDVKYVLARFQRRLMTVAITGILQNTHFGIAPKIAWTIEYLRVWRIVAGCQYSL